MRGVNPAQFHPGAHQPFHVLRHPGIEPKVKVESLMPQSDRARPSDGAGPTVYDNDDRTSKNKKLKATHGCFSDRSLPVSAFHRT
jgi:hypothetical protein